MRRLSLAIFLLGLSAAASAQTMTSLAATPVWTTLAFAAPGSGNLQVSQSTLNFTSTAGGATPASQKLTVTSSLGNSDILPFLTTTSALWITLDVPSGNTPQTINVSVNPQGMNPGTYNGTINFYFTSLGQQQRLMPPVAVTLTINSGGGGGGGGSASLNVSPTALSFNYVAGSSSQPAAQTFSVSSSSSSSLPVTLTLSSASGGSWFMLDSTSGNTPQTFTVSVNKQVLGTLSAGNYSGTITVASSTSGVQSVPVNVSLTVTTQSSGGNPQLTTITSNASNVSGPIAAGELIVIKGSNLGPSPGVSFGLNAQGAVNPTLSGVQVMFDNHPGTPIYVSANQINVTVPWEIASQVQTSLVVQYNGNQSPPFVLGVVPVQLEIYTLDSTGSGPAVALNQNYTINGPAAGVNLGGTVVTTSPASASSVLTLYATGGGLTSPPGATGSVSSSTQLMPLTAFQQSGNVTATIGGKAATIQFAGAAPGLVTGVNQLNIQVPAGVTGNNLPVVITVNGAQNKGAPTVAVQ